jgi:hypothetical protein
MIPCATVSGGFSIVGLTAIFAGAFWPVVGMGGGPGGQQAFCGLLARALRPGRLALPGRPHHGRSTKSGMTAPQARETPAPVLLWTIGGALRQPIGQSVAGPKLLDQSCYVVAASPAARRASDAQHVELADQSADRSITGHGGQP